MNIITGGVAKAEVADALRPLLGPNDAVTVGTDMNAAMALRTGRADYYLGTCHTGAGASLGVLVGLLGSSKCHTFGRSVPSKAAVEGAVAAGNLAFGFALDQVHDVVPLIWSALSARKS